MKNYTAARERMVENQLEARGITDIRVLYAMRKVPRHLFLPEALRSRAYEDCPLPIGENQTISQPYMVALMTQALELKSTDIVLEVGTGSGYQSAVLAEIVKQVYSIERIKDLFAQARKILDKLRYTNIATKNFDGTYGWKENSPFDAIIVTAGSPGIPHSLIEQLAVGGRLVIPVGDSTSQTLKRVRKKEEGIEIEELCSCVFVKLIGKYAWTDENNNSKKNLIH